MERDLGGIRWNDPYKILCTVVNNFSKRNAPIRLGRWLDASKMRKIEPGWDGKVGE
jgi:hypothetical protein